METILMTGGHGGIGLVAARYLAGTRRKNLILAGRSEGALGRAAADLGALGVRVTTVPLDLTSLTSVEAAVRQVRTLVARGEVRLEAIVCNAGLRAPEKVSWGADGYEETFAANHLGHFALVQGLVEDLADQGRVVFTASGTHDPERTDGKLVGAAALPEAPTLAHVGRPGFPGLSSGRRYTTSKLCNVMTAYELDRRFRQTDKPRVSIAFDPGLVSGTDFLRHTPKPVQWLSRTAFFDRLARRMGVTMGSLAFSGECLGRLAADPEFSVHSGKYFESNDGALVEARSSKVSYDQALARRLWDESDQLIRAVTVGAGGA